jgi:hypothetical protein
MMFLFLSIGIAAGALYLFFLYVKRTSFDEGKTSEKLSNEEYNSQLQRKYAELAKETTRSPIDIIECMRKDGHNT